VPEEGDRDGLRGDPDGTHDGAADPRHSDGHCDSPRRRSDGVLTVLRKATATAGRGDPGRRTFISAVVEISEAFLDFRSPDGPPEEIRDGCSGRCRGSDRDGLAEAIPDGDDDFGVAEGGIPEGRFDSTLAVPARRRSHV
jgi:hypothetical protein